MSNPGTELASLDFGNLIGGPLDAVIKAQANAAKSTADFIKSVGFDEDQKPVYVAFKYPKEVQPAQAARNPQVVQAKVTIAGSGYGSNQVVQVKFSSASGEIAATGTLTADANGDIPIDAQVNIISGGDYPTITPSISAIVDAPPTGGTKAIIASSAISLSAKVEATLAVFQEMKFEVPLLTMLPIPFIKVDLITIDFNAKINSIETQSENSELAVSGSLEVRQRWAGGGAKLNVSCAYKKTNSSSSSIERTYSMGIHVQASQDEMPAGMEKLLSILEGAMISTPGPITSGH